ncbi:MAG: Crp/Fnr family transcriptional regulator [Chloroflexi bacterium]|nr:Crp/Fnr family transcriptional regulator [Chloroflexota bacterium]MBV9544443.1 Crp/Fnr family transcriptional regulator [Chloroflexota bacterium]
MPATTLVRDVPKHQPQLERRTREKPRAVSAAELRALGSPFFEGLADADLAALGAAMFQRSYPAGQIVLLEGAASSVLYVVQRGRLKLYKTSARGREQVLRLLRPGDMFNEVAVFDEGPNPASAQTIEDCTLYLLRRRDLVRFVTDRPGIALAITSFFARRLREAMALVEDLAFRDVTSRLAKILLEGRDPRVTQELLAAMAGSRREVVGRALKAMSVAGVVRLERGRIHVRDRSALERLAWGTPD